LAEREPSVNPTLEQAGPFVFSSVFEHMKKNTVPFRSRFALDGKQQARLERVAR